MSERTRGRRRSIPKGRWQRVGGGITAAEGFVAAGIHAGIKKTGLDLAIVFTPRDALACGVFTTNQVQAAPVLLSRERIREKRGQNCAILLNSGCANACTGAAGLEDARTCTEVLARALERQPQDVLMASTGVIGPRLPVRKMTEGIRSAAAVLSRRGGRSASQAIMTTDTREKVASVRATVRRKPLHIGGMAKGAGMIHPDMATMLSVITTDARLPYDLMTTIFRRVVERTFHCLTIDGDTSTNDTVFFMANGASGVTFDKGSVEFFEEGLYAVCEKLASSVARDGEGASKFVEIVVDGARSFEQARSVGKSVARSSLVKTALYGQQLNWGRILSAAGQSGVKFDPDAVTLLIGGIPVYAGGHPSPANHRRAEKILRKAKISIKLTLGQGPESAKVWSCDLGHEYIDINGTYIS